MSADERTHLSLPGKLCWRECLSRRRTAALFRGCLLRGAHWWTQRDDLPGLHFAWPLFHQGCCRVGSSWTQPGKSARKLRAFCLATVARLRHVFGYCRPGNGDGWVCHKLICGSGEFTFAIAVSYHQTGWPVWKWKDQLSVLVRTRRAPHVLYNRSVQTGPSAAH